MLILGAKRLWRYFLKEVQDIGGIQQWLYSELLISHYPTIDFSLHAGGFGDHRRFHGGGIHRYTQMKLQFVILSAYRLVEDFGQSSGKHKNDIS